MCERLKQAVLKTAIRETVSGVRIPLPPPANLLAITDFGGSLKNEHDSRANQASVPLVSVCYSSNSRARMPFAAVSFGTRFRRSFCLYTGCPHGKRCHRIRLPTDLMKATDLNGVTELGTEIEREVFTMMREAA